MGAEEVGLICPLNPETATTSHSSEHLPALVCGSCHRRSCHRGVPATGVPLFAPPEPATAPGSALPSETPIPPSSRFEGYSKVGVVRGAPEKKYPSEPWD